MNPSNGTLFLLAVIGAWSMVQYEYAQSPHLSPAMNARLQELLSPPFPDESARQKAAVVLITTHGRNEAAEMLAEFVSSHSLDANQLYEARELGQHLRPEFDSAVLSAIQAASNPNSIGRLILLLRTSSDVKIIPTLGSLLLDQRVGEVLPDEWQANGAIAFRVCDIAYNMLQEVQATDKSTARLLNRSQSSDARYHLISLVLRQAAETQGKVNIDAAIPPKEPSQPQPPPVLRTPTMKKEADSPAVALSEQETSSTP